MQYMQDIHAISKISTFQKQERRVIRARSRRDDDEYEEADGEAASPGYSQEQIDTISTLSTVYLQHEKFLISPM